MLLEGSVLEAGYSDVETTDRKLNDLKKRAADAIMHSVEPICTGTKCHICSAYWRCKNPNKHCLPTL